LELFSTLRLLPAFTDDLFRIIPVDERTVATEADDEKQQKSSQPRGPRALELELRLDRGGRGRGFGRLGGLLPQ
jgi:hypothetical protein